MSRRPRAARQHRAVRRHVITPPLQGHVMTRTQRKIAFALALLALAAAAPAVAAIAARDRAAGRETKLRRALDQVVATGAPGAVLLVREGDRKIRLTTGHGNLNPKTP